MATLRMQPPPRDFTLRPWKYGIEPASIRKVIVAGIPRTAMPAMKSQLTPRDLDALVAHVLLLADAPPAHARQETPADQRLRVAGFAPVAIHRLAPTLRVRDAHDEEVDLAGLRGRVVLINFWGTSCVHCLEKLPQLAELEKELGPQGLSVLSICADEDDVQAAQQVASRRAPGHRVYVDTSGLAQHEFEVQLLPTVWLVDRAGRLVARSTTAPDWRQPEFQQVIRSLLNQSK